MSEEDFQRQADAINELHVQIKSWKQMHANQVHIARNWKEQAETAVKELAERAAYWEGRYQELITASEEREKELRELQAIVAKLKQEAER